MVALALAKGDKDVEEIISRHSAVLALVDYYYSSFLLKQK